MVNFKTKSPPQLTNCNEKKAVPRRATEELLGAGAALKTKEKEYIPTTYHLLTMLNT